MSLFNNAITGAAGQQGYNISRSVRLRSSASAYLNRTFTTPTDSTKFTFSAWIKRGSLGSSQGIFQAGNTNYIQFGSADTIQLVLSNTTQLTTASVYRDPAAWGHLVISYNNAVSPKWNFYYNSVNIGTSTASNTTLNTATAHGIANPPSGGGYFDGYLTEINFIDGQALTPSSFGSTNALTGVWQPAKYTGTYGTNGFYLNFSDNSSNTATTIGKDYSGNGNNWTPNNISVTAGVTYDSMTDVPTLTSATAANYCVLNPLYRGYGGYTATPLTISNANLTITGNASANNIAATMALPTTGQFYYEYVWTATAGGEMDGGIIGESGIPYYYRYDGTYYNGSTYVSYGAAYTTNDVIGVAVDMTNLTFTFYKNNVSQGTKTSAFPSGITYFPWFYTSNTVAASVNFGQRPFTYTPPTGFVALNTYNLPASTIKNGAAYMAATTYTGNGSTTGNTQSISNAVNGVSFQPDLVWVKSRSAATFNILVDSVRGTNTTLYSNGTNAEESLSNVMNSFNSGGFTAAYNSAYGNVVTNANAVTYVGWQWKAGTTSASNTNGSITSTVSAGATQGFSVVTYTGNSTNNATVGHGLGVVPSMIILKNRSGAYDWPCYHISIGSGKYIYLNQTATAATDANMWKTTPTSTVFTLGTYTENNGSSNNYVAYCFSAVAGYSAFGSYTGNGSTDGPFVYTGFRPRFILVKSSSGAFDWHITDTSRSTYNQADTVLFPNSSAAESNGGGYYYDLLSNGFKCRNLGSATNGSGATYIFAAFAESPFKTSLAR